MLSCAFVGVDDGVLIWRVCVEIYGDVVRDLRAVAEKGEVLVWPVLASTFEAPQEAPGDAAACEQMPISIFKAVKNEGKHAGHLGDGMELSSLLC